MIRRQTGLAVVGVAFMLWSSEPVPAAVQISGQVVNSATGEALAGVVISVRGRATEHKLDRRTDNNGRFAFDPADALPREDLDSRSLTLTFGKSGFRNHVKVLKTEERGRFRWREGKVELVPTSGIGTLTDDERAALDRIRSESGRTLYLVPYDFVAAGSSLNADNFNALLPFQINLGIVGHLQELEVEGAERLVSIEQMQSEITGTNANKMIVFGRYLKALGMIGGLAILKAGAEGEDEIQLNSKFHVIPTVTAPGDGVVLMGDVSVLDRFPARKLMAFEDYGHLNVLWGRATVLALCMWAYEEARRGSDLEALEAIETLLERELASIGPDNDELVGQLTEMIEIVRTDIDGLRARGEDE